MPAQDGRNSVVARPPADAAAGATPPGPRPAPFVLRRIGFTPATRRDPASDPRALGLEPINEPIQEAPNGVCTPESCTERGQHAEARPRRELFAESAVNLRWSRVRLAGAGLVNNNNYCYMNACLQVLLHTPPFVEVLLDNPSLVPCTRLFSGAMRKLAESAYGGQRIVRPPKEFYQFLKKISSSFTRGYQEDSHEFLRGLLTRIHEECLTKLQSPYTEQEEETSFVYRIFGGVTRSRIHCPTLNYTSEKLESFLDLSLELEHARSVEDALRQFTASEKLDGENAFKHKGQYTPAVKRFTVHKLPAVLTINLKRFAFGRGKIRREVKYPTTLDLAPFSSKPDSKESAVYKLYGVIVHDGYLVHMGHYVAYAKAANGVWYRFDDEHVAEVSLDAVLAEQAYMLFYIKSESQHQKKGVNAMGKKNPHSSLNGRIPFVQKSQPSPCAGAKGPVIVPPKQPVPPFAPVADIHSSEIKGPRSTSWKPNLETKAPMARNAVESPRTMPSQNGSPTRTADGLSRCEYPRCNGTGLISAEHQPAAAIGPASASSDKEPTVCTPPVMDHNSKAKPQRRNAGRGQLRTSPPLGVRNMHKKKKSPSVQFRWALYGKHVLQRLISYRPKSIMGQKTSQFCAILRQFIDPLTPESPHQENGDTVPGTPGKKSTALSVNVNEGGFLSAGASSNSPGLGRQHTRCRSEAANPGHNPHGLENGASTSVPVALATSNGSQAGSQQTSDPAGLPRQGNGADVNHWHCKQKAGSSAIPEEVTRDSDGTSFGGTLLAVNPGTPHPERLRTGQIQGNGKVGGARLTTAKRKRDEVSHPCSTSSPYEAITNICTPSSQDREAKANGSFQGTDAFAPGKLATRPSQAEPCGSEVRQTSSSGVWAPGSKGLYGVPVSAWDTVEDADVEMATTLSSLSAPARKKLDVYDEEYDRGKTKKVKKQRITDGGNMNVFQTHFDQRRKSKG
eukprot:evm.model.scf_230.2 EVM.evm.TU.scf_230.2   scf_230:37155-45596(+)